MADGRLPNLRRLVQNGGFAATEIRDHATETLTGHVEILSGYPPNTLGIWNLKRFRVLPYELTVFARLKGHFSPADFTTVWLTSKATRLSGLPGGVWFDTRPQLNIWDGDVDRTNAKTGPIAVRYLRQYARPDAKFFMFFHFKEPDNQGHNFGENSPEYDAALIAVDGWLGEILAVLRAQGVDEMVAVLVTTDHGFDEDGMHHKHAPDAWLATNWAPLTGGDQKDVAPTLLTLYGVDPGRFDPPLPGRPLWTRAR